MKNGNMLILEPPIGIDSKDELGHLRKTIISKLAFASNNLQECNNFVSWTYTKFVRFFIAICICKLGSIIDQETWRFVPDPDPFDHIFTDAELYKKYNLSSEEINIIESVIKERK